MVVTFCEPWTNGEVCLSHLFFIVVFMVTTMI